MIHMGGVSGGLAMMAAGLFKAYTHMVGVGTIHMTTCLGQEIILKAPGSVWQNTHCWGCYLALAGALVAVASLTGRIRRVKGTFLRG